MIMESVRPLLSRHFGVQNDTKNTVIWHLLSVQIIVRIDNS
jgi:hypothetical protein